MPHAWVSYLDARVEASILYSGRGARRDGAVVPLGTQITSGLSRPKRRVHAVQEA